MCPAFGTMGEGGAGFAVLRQEQLRFVCTRTLLGLTRGAAVVGLGAVEVEGINLPTEGRSKALKGKTNRRAGDKGLE